MTEYKDTVIKHAMFLEAEEWARGVSQIHMHSLNSMYYDKWPEDTESGSVTDTTYNNGTIVRTKGGEIIRVIGEELLGDKLIDVWSRHNQKQAEVLQAL
jgi:hypothetical protein